MANRPLTPEEILKHLCVSYDLTRVPGALREPLRRLFNQLNRVIVPYIDARTTLNQEFFTTEEWQQAVAEYVGEAPWIEIAENADGVQEVRHRGPGPIATQLGVPGMFLETLDLDLYLHTVGGTSRAIGDAPPGTYGGDPNYIQQLVVGPGGRITAIVPGVPAGQGENYWWCRINDGAAHADEWYNVTQVDPTAADAYVDVVGGIGTVAAKNLAEEADGTHDLDDHTALAPNVVLVTTKEDENGDAVYTFRRVIPGANYVPVPFEVAVQTGVVPANSAVMHQAGTTAGEKRAYFKFTAPLVLTPTDTMLICRLGPAMLAAEQNWAAPAQPPGPAYFYGAFVTANFDNTMTWMTQPPVTTDTLIGELSGEDSLNHMQGAFIGGVVDGVGTTVYGIRLRALAPAGGTVTWGLARVYSPTTPAGLRCLIRHP